jgi:hypothetical protein
MRRWICLFLLAACARKHAEPAPVARPLSNEPQKLAYASDAFVGRWKIEVRFTARPNSPSFEVAGEFIVRFAKAGPDALDMYLE